MERKLISKYDILLIAVLLIGFILFFTFNRMNKSNNIATVYYNDEIVETVNLTSLSEKKTIKTGSDGNCIICAENGEIYFVSSNCKDKICVRSKHLSQNGDFSACLPQKVVITVKGEKLSDLPDVISY